MMVHDTGARRDSGRRIEIRVLVLSLSLSLVVLAACGRDAKNPVAPAHIAPGTVVPDFSLADVNPNSATAGQAVSPRQHAGQISAWYFGHST
jgi:hypothetical protein